VMAFFELDFVDRHSLVRGDDFSVTVRWLRDGQPMPLASWTGEARLVSPTTGLNIAGPVPTTLDDDGNISFRIPRVQTAVLSKGDLLLYVTLTDNADVKQTRVLGRVGVI
jgi:hypothetical protein